jgi:hypothetical protein
MAENSEEGTGDPRIKNALFLGKERKTVTTYGSCESSTETKLRVYPGDPVLLLFLLKLLPLFFQSSTDPSNFL